MTRIVLYADDMEPITVLDLSESSAKYLKECGMVQLAVMETPQFVYRKPEDTVELPTIRIVTIFAERFIRNGREHFILVTRDEESALLLKSAFLPGQHHQIDERERKAFAHGFLSAIARLNDGG